MTVFAFSLSGRRAQPTSTPVEYDEEHAVLVHVSCPPLARAHVGATAQLPAPSGSATWPAGPT
jgi:hypothetical protein